MNFLEKISRCLEQEGARIFQEEVREGRLYSVSGKQLLENVLRVRQVLADNGVQPGDRCVLIAPNGIRWTSLNLGIMAHGALCVPLYSRQAPGELAAMIRDCRPSMVFYHDEGSRKELEASLGQLPGGMHLDAVFSAPSLPGGPASLQKPALRKDSDGVTILYTSGTSGEAKGVLLTVGNLDHMLQCTDDRLTCLMRGKESPPDRVYHYLPCNFAGSWILMLTSLIRGSRLSFCTDLNRIGEDLPLVAPDYLLNVPVLLERIRKGIEDKLRNRGGVALRLFHKASQASVRIQAGSVGWQDSFWCAVADRLIFRAIRRKMGGRLGAMICGSAPLALETQQFFLMLGIRVLQVYGLTETTAICTMDHPDKMVPGMVGPAIQGTEMKLGVQDEILVRGPHIFAGYWNRPSETQAVFQEGWFRTGDQGIVDAQGNWRIIGRIKNLLILNSGHNIAPEPLEEYLLKAVPGSRQAVLVGHGRSHLTLLLTGEVQESSVGQVLERMNADLPHYKRIRGFRLLPEVFTIENGLLTANGKLKRDQILSRWSALVEEMYAASFRPASTKRESL
jgi:long-chain acyl-CoA synthetase